MRNKKWIIFGLLFIVFMIALRLYPASTNLPQIYWHDENNYIETALRFGTGNLRPPSLYHGMFFQLILFCEYAAFYAIKKITTAGYGQSDFLSEYIRDPSDFYLIGRATAALFGVGCIILVYLISLKLYNKRVAIISAIFSGFALSPFIESTYTKAEPASSLFLLLAFFAAIPIFNVSYNRGAPSRYYIISGFLVGLAASAKLSAVFGLSFIVLAHLFNYKPAGPCAGVLGFIRHSFDGRMITGAISSLAGFVLGSPYVLVNPSFFFDNVKTMQKATFNPDLSSPWMIYFSEHLRNVTGSRWLGILILISCVFFISRRSKKALMLLAYPVSFYLLYMHYNGYAHYLVPVIPFLLIIAAAFLDVISKNIFFKEKNIIIAISVLILALPCFLDIIRYLALRTKPDTRNIAKAWIEKNIPTTVSILSEGYINAVAIHVPQIKGNINTLKRDMVDVKKHGRGLMVESEIKLAQKDTISPRYDILKKDVLNSDYLRKTTADYVILSSYVDKDAGEREYTREKDFRFKRKALYDELEKDYTLIQKISPYPDLGYAFPVFLVDDFKKMRSIKLFADVPRLQQGPEIKIFRKK